MMPSYLFVLESNLTARDRAGITEEGHKIKGAAGSIGLKHLQQLAKNDPPPELPAWWDNVQEWVDELERDWRKDVESLRNWLADARKNNPNRRLGCANTAPTPGKLFN